MAVDRFTTKTHTATGVEPQAKSPSTKPATKTSTATVVPVGTSNKPNEIIAKLIDSKEFRELSYQEQMKELSAHFPNADEQELREILTNITTQINATKTDAQQENDSSVSSAGVDVDKLVKDIVANTDNKRLELSKDQVNALKKALAGLKSETLDLSNPKEVQTLLSACLKLLDNIIPKETLKSEDWQKLTSTEKLNAKLDAMLSYLTPEYSDYKNENKAQIKNSIIDTIGRSLNPNWEKLTKNSKDFGVQIAGTLLDALDKKGISVQDVMNMPAEKQHALINEFMGKALDTYFIGKIDTESEEWKALSPDEQFNKIIDTIILSINPNISSEDIVKLREEWTNVIGSMLYGEDWNDPKIQEVAKELIVTKLTAINNYAKANNISAAECMQDTRTYIKAMEEYEKANGIKLSDSDRILRDVMRENNKMPVTNEDIKNYLVEKEKNGTITDSERKELKRIEQLEVDYQKTHETMCARRNELLEKQKTEGLTEEEKQELKELNEDIKNYKPDDILTKVERKDSSDDLSYIIKKYPGKNNTERLEAWLANNGINVDDLDDEARLAILNSIDDLEYRDALREIFGISADDARYLDLDFKTAMDSISRVEKQSKRRQMWIAASASTDTSVAIAGAYGAIAESATPAEQADATHKIVKQKESHAGIAPVVLHEVGATDETIIDAGNRIANDKDINSKTAGTFIDTAIKIAPNDDSRVKLGQGWAEGVKNPDVLEYIGAASKYIEDPGKKTQYTSYVKEAAKSYPPETQAKVQKAIDTGKVSTKSESVHISAPKTEQKTGTQPVATPQAAAAPDIAVIPNVVQTPTVTPTTTSTAASNIDKVNQKTTEALQQKKDKALENIENHITEVAADQAAREITDAEIEEFADAIQEIETIEDASKINQEKIKSFINSNSVSTIYSKLIQKFGNVIIYKLISAVALTGNTSKIEALASIIKSGSMLEELFAKCKSKRLLDKLQPSTVKRFIPYINDLSAVRSDIMYEFIMDLINSNAGIDEIKKYLAYLPFGMQASICNTYNNLKGVSLDGNFALSPQRKNNQTEEETTVEEKPQQVQDKQNIAENKTPALENNEVTAENNALFADIDNQNDNEPYEVVDNQTGKTQSQREEVLTPGSYEWNLKYNKQAPKTAFTMAALEEDEEENGIGIFGSTKVGMGQKIKKKYPPQSFKFNA
ncbi:MAG: hypothetical protein NC191_07375 [Muribaculaceae bacterium]|nr:hypothetical protein [Muribaculaceae bacterium]